MNSRIEDESDDGYNDQESGSETENADSQTSEEEDEIELENLKLDDDSTQRSLFSPKTGITWSSIPFPSKKPTSSNDTAEKGEPTKFTENASTIQDAFTYFITEKFYRRFGLFLCRTHP